jgi:hypothetical protein
MSIELDADYEILASTFASRVQLAKMSEGEAVEEARVDFRKAIAWVDSPSKAAGSFLWFCEELNQDPAAVRRAIKEKRK